MNIDRIDLYSAAEPESLATATKFVELGLKNVDHTDSYILERAWGLSGAEVIGNIYGGYGSDSYRRLFMQERQIALKIRLNPNWGAGETFSSLRDDLYKLISATRTGLTEIQLMEGGVQQAFIQGVIIKFEADTFTLDPLVQITIECTYPLFRSPTYTVLDLTVATGSGEVMPDFSWTDDISTAPHGFQLTLDYVADLTGDIGLMIMPEWGDDNKRFWVQGPFPFTSGKQFKLSSEEDNKYLIWGGVETDNVLDMLRRDTVQEGSFSMWPIMFPGTTHIGLWRQESPQLDMDTRVAWNEIRYRHHFWGV